MAEKILLVELFQPLAQYRNPFTFYYAQTYPLPPKSTIIGMLQNALNDWYGHERGVDRWWNLKVSVHGGFESVFWNYQQLIKATKTGISLVRFRGRPVLWNQNRPLYGFPITSQRSPVLQQELFNGWLYILLQHEDEEFLEEIKRALETPGKVLSLGRSEDIVFIRRVEFLEKTKHRRARDIAIKYPTYVRVTLDTLRKKEYPTYAIPVKVVFGNDGKPIKHKAEITSKTFRDVKFESAIYVGAWTYLKFEKEVSVEEYSLDGMKFKVINDKRASGWL
ncbi:CRISPR-associated protein Cas5 [Thermococcus atlanticus]